MNLAEYQKRAARTLLAAPAQPLTDQEIVLNWCLVGLVGECWEFYQACTLGSDKDKIIKEAGDVSWYAAGVFTTLGKDISNHIGMWPDDAELINCIGYACEALEQYKKQVFHAHGLDQDELLKKVWYCLWAVRKYLIKTGITFSSVLDTNITKLEARYPTGFNTQDSIKRVDVEHAQS